MKAKVSPLPPLTAEDIRFFCREGYLVKRAALEPEMCSRIRDAMWMQNASRHISREDAGSWLGPFPVEDESADMMNYRKADQWRLRGLCSTKLVLDAFPRRVQPWLRQLVGGVIEPREGSRRGWNNWGGFETRGIYCVLPTVQTTQALGESPANAAAETVGVPSSSSISSMVESANGTDTDTSGSKSSKSTISQRGRQILQGHNGSQFVGNFESAHVDPQPSKMVIACYLDDVPERGGGFCIFPRSHHALYEQDTAFADYAHASFNYADPERARRQGAPADQIDAVGNPRFKPALAAAVAAAKQVVTSSIRPRQISGGVGDVILTHGRLWHMGSANCVPRTLRQAMFYDVVTPEDDRAFHLQTNDQGPIDRYRGCARGDDRDVTERLSTVLAAVWHGWSPEVQSVAHSVALSQSDSDTQKCARSGSRARL